MKTTCLKSSKTVLSSVTPCGAVWPSPPIPSSSEIQQFSAKTGGKNEKKSAFTAPHAIPESWLSHLRVAQWAAEEEKQGRKKKGKVCKTIPPWPVQPHWLSHIDCPAAPFLQHSQAGCARAKGYPAAPVFQRHSGKTDLKARMAVVFLRLQKTHSTMRCLVVIPTSCSYMASHYRKTTEDSPLSAFLPQHLYFYLQEIQFPAWK